MKQIMPFLFFLVSCSSTIEDRFHSDYLFYGLSNISQVNKPTKVCGVVKRNSKLPFRPVQKEVRVTFRYKDRMLFDAISDSQGLACGDVSFKEKGLKQIEMNIEGDSQDFSVYIMSPGDRFFVTDIDHTIFDGGAYKFVFEDHRTIPPMKNSVKVLRQIESSAQVVYLTARAESFLPETRLWLDFKDYPKGPVFSRNFYGERGHSSKAYEFKYGVIRSIIDNGGVVIAGIGDATHDVRAYKDNHSVAIYFKKDGDFEKLEFKHIKTSDWNDVLKVIKDKSLD